MTENPQSPPSFGSIIEQLYAGTLDDAAWGRGLLRCADLVRASGVCLFAMNPSSGEILRDEIHRVSPDTASEYRRHWTFEDSRREAALTVPVCTPITEASLQIPGWRRSALVNDFLLPHDLPHVVATWLHKGTNKITLLSLQGTRHRGRFESSDIELFQHLLPHLRQALEIRDRLHTAKVAATALAYGLDAISAGVLVLDGNGRVLDSNAEARALIASQNGVRCERDGTLRLREPAGAQLRGWLTRGKTPPCSADGLIHISRPAALPLSVLVARLPSPENSWIGSDPRWLLMIFDPERGIRASPEIIASDLGVTAREAELTVLLVAGHSLQSAARRLKVSAHTARTQLKSIFRKTNLHTQAELIRRVALGPASSGILTAGSFGRYSPS